MNDVGFTPSSFRFQYKVSNPAPRLTTWQAFDVSWKEIYKKDELNLSTMEFFYSTGLQAPR